MAFANLEAPLTEGGAPSEKWINMRMAPALLGNLRALGFDVFTIANNHLMDYGYEGFADTLRHLRAADFPFVGGGEDLDAAWAAQVVSAGRAARGPAGWLLDAGGDAPGDGAAAGGGARAPSARVTPLTPTRAWNNRAARLTCIRGPGRATWRGRGRPLRQRNKTRISW